jgi:hypothetical protein
MHNVMKQQEAALVSLAVVFREANEQELRGERIDYAIAPGRSSPG